MKQKERESPVEAAAIYALIDFNSLDQLLFPSIKALPVAGIGTRIRYGFNEGTLCITNASDRIYNIETPLLHQEFWVSHQSRIGNQTDILDLYGKMVDVLSRYHVVAKDIIESVQNRLDAARANLDGHKGAPHKSSQSRRMSAEKDEAQARQLVFSSAGQEVYLRGLGETLFREAAGVHIGKHDMRSRLTQFMRGHYRRARLHVCHEISEEAITFHQQKLDSGLLSLPEPIKPDFNWIDRKIEYKKAQADANESFDKNHKAKLKSAGKSLVEAIDLCRNGLSASVIPRLSNMYDVKRNVVMGWLNIDDGVNVLTGHAVEHCIALFQLHDELLSYFDSPEKAEKWLKSPLANLADRSPLSCLDVLMAVNKLVEHVSQLRQLKSRF
jgi:hypothetical protein